MSLLQISADSNLLYLPLVYFLPQDLIKKCPTLYSLPRKVREVVYSEEMMAVVNSDAFFSEITDASAAMVFPHFGFSGWKEHYTGYCPVWKLCYMLPIWARLLEAETGWGLQRLFYIPSVETIPFFTSDYIEEVMGRIVKRAIQEEGWQPTLDVVREMPCDEDFENWNTNVRKDFLRKWYHTRSKKVQMVSLEGSIEDVGNGIHALADPSSHFVEQVVADDFYRRFRLQLLPRDMEILDYRIQGFTYEQIANVMGYKNHSGVLKRMSAIKKAFIEYEQH